MSTSPPARVHSYNPRAVVESYFNSRLGVIERLWDESARLILRAEIEKAPRSRERLANFARQYGDDLSQRGVFCVKVASRAPKAKMPSTECHVVSGFVLEPVKLRQGFGQTTRYDEPALLLRGCVARVRQKRSTFGIGATPVLLTQHMLERVYERTEIGPAELPSVLHENIEELIRNLALVDVADLWVEASGELMPSRLTAVPFANGLLVLNSRTMFSSAEMLGGYFHLRMNQPVNPFACRGMIVDPGSEPALLQFAKEGMIMSVSSCSLTYFNSLTLDGNEADYYYAFQALREQFDGKSLLEAARELLMPRFQHENPPDFAIKSEHRARVARLREILKRGWLRAPAAAPVCVLTQ